MPPKRTPIALALAAALFATPAVAQKVDLSRAGLKATSADGNFEFKLGGRVHFDVYAFDRDRVDVNDTSDFRRARLTLSGKVYGWEYKLDHDFAADTARQGFRDVFIARQALGGKFTVGQFKPYRSMEELTSSNEITMMERPFATATGLYGGRQFQYGVGYLRPGGHYTAGVSVFNLRNAAVSANEGAGVAGRVTYAPINDAVRTLHLGASISRENTNRDSPNLSARAPYAGRGGPSQTIATTTGISGDSVDTVGLELAGAWGAAFFQSEYAHARFGQPLGGAQEVDTWYVMGSYLLSGERKPYKAGTGVFGSPAASRSWELTARYDRIENHDLPGRRASSASVGVNFYLNPNVRMMFNVVHGHNEVTGDRTGQYALRTQIMF